MDAAAVRRIFDAAVALPAAERAAYLGRECGDEPVLRREVERLLNALTVAESIFHSADLTSGRIPALAPGTSLGPYKLIGTLGAGGMGEVYKAQDTRLDRTVAIKVLPSHLASNPDARIRFDREAKAIAALNHPNICALFDIGHEGGIDFLVMEFVDGETLEHRLAEGRPSIDEGLRITVAIAEAISNAHDHGIVHRDLKPSNVMITHDGVVKVLDFGLARSLADGPPDGASDTMTVAQSTSDGRIVGTVSYMSPEQAEGRPVDRRSDVFSLGVILYQILTGRRPFVGVSSVAIICSIAKDTPISARTHNAAVPESLETILNRALAKNPRDRYPTAYELERELTAVATSIDTATLTSFLRGHTTFSRRLQLLAIALVALISIIGVRIATRRLFGDWARASTDRIDSHVIAVLPFANISATAGREYIAAGLAEEVHSRLSRVADFKVLSRQAVERFKPTDVKALATDLGVGSIVHGSVRSDKDHVRIDVELVDSRTERILWSEEYDRDLKDVLDVQRDVAIRVTGVLNARLSTADRDRLRPTQNADAYDLYLRSHALPCGDQTSIDLLTRAVTLDSHFAVAHARLGWQFICLGLRKDAKYFDSAMDAARKAIDADPRIPDGYHLFGAVLTEQGRAGEARLALLRAQTLDPNSIDIFDVLSDMELEVGRLDEALMWAVREFKLAPNEEGAHFHIGTALLFLGDDQATERWLRTSKGRSATESHMRLVEGMYHAIRGDLDVAFKTAKRLYEANSDVTDSLALVSEIAYLSSAPAAEALNRSLTDKRPDVQTCCMFVASPRVRYAYTLKSRGEREVAVRIVDSARSNAQDSVAKGNELPRVQLELASIAAFNGLRDEVFQSLERAYSAGLRDYRTLNQDPIFGEYRTDPRFSSLLARMKADVAAMRQRANIPSILPAP